MNTQLPETGLIGVRLLLACHRLEKQLATTAGLSVDEFHCLTLLYVHSPCCVKELGEILGVGPSRVSRLLHNLEKMDYLTRSLGYTDKRKELLALTEEGTVAAEKVLAAAGCAVPGLIGSMPEEIAGPLLRSFR